VQRDLGHLTTVQKMEQWQKEKPELLVRTVDSHAVLTVHKTLMVDVD